MNARIAFGIFLCPSLSTAGAQSFVDTSNAWSIVECWNFGPCFSRYYRFIGDTLLDGQVFHKLYISPLPDMSMASLAIVMREDSDHMVYGYQDTSEFVYYDMDMVVGDSITVTTDHCPFPVTYEVQSIDTLTLLNGEQRRRWHLYVNGWGWTDEWIEGIGSIWGPFSHHVLYCMADLYWSLNCFTQNDTLKYQAFPSCDYTTADIVELRAEQAVQLSPNPFHDDLRVVTNRSCPNGTIEVFDDFGRLVLHRRGDLELGVKLDGSELSVGLYNMRCSCAEDLSVVRKVIKQ